MDRGPISLKAHAMIEPIAALIVILSPWIFSFSATDDAKVIAIVVGIAMLATGMATRWRYSLVKLLSLRTHFMMDLAVGAVLILSPFVFGFTGAGGATRFFVIAGILELLTAVSTRWVPEEADARYDRSPQASRA
jgi:hypothetical protein